MSKIYSNLTLDQIIDLTDQYCYQTDPLGDNRRFMSQLELYGDYGAYERHVFHFLYSTSDAIQSADELIGKLKIPNMTVGYQVSSNQGDFNSVLIGQETELFSPEFDLTVKHIGKITRDCGWKYGEWGCEVLSLAPISELVH